MTKYLLVFFLSCGLIGSRLSAQIFGNEWIDYNLTYYKYTSDKNGLHRIPFESLISLGIAVNAAHIKIFARGAQIPIYTSSSGEMGPGDYIEFYGEANDGYFDTQLYAISDWQSKPGESLFTDRMAYFLTSDEAPPHLRVLDTQNDFTPGEVSENYFIHTSVNSSQNAFHQGLSYDSIAQGFPVGPNFSMFLSDFEEGECFVGPTVMDGLPYTVNIATPNVSTAGPSMATVTMRTQSRDMIYNNYSLLHQIISVGGTIYVDSLSSQNHRQNYVFAIPISALGEIITGVKYEAADGIEAISGIPYSTKYAPAITSISYPHSFDFENKQSFYFKADISEDRFFEIINFNGGGAPVVYDLSTNERIIPVLQDGIYKFKVHFEANVPVLHELFISNTTDAGGTVMIQDNEFAQRYFTNYALPENQGEYIIITHPLLRSGDTDWVEQYRRYRQTGMLTDTPEYDDTNGKNSSVSSFDHIVIADIEELYDQYAHGIAKHPLAIKNFINNALDGQSSGQWSIIPEYVFIIGKGIDYRATRNNSTSFDKCLVPSYGHNPSDQMLVTPADGNSWLPQVAIGRLPATSPEDVMAFLTKMIEYEKAFEDAENYCDIAHRMWMKNTLFVATGWGQEAMQIYKSFGDEYAAVVQGAEAGLYMVDYLTDTCNHCYFPSPQLPGYIEAGLSYINFNGEGTGSQWGFDLDDPQMYDNTGKYPFIISSTDYAGWINNNSNFSMSEKWVLAPDHGAIAHLAPTFLEFPAYMHEYTEALTHHLFQSHYGQPIGFCMKQAMADIYDENDLGVKYTSMEYTLAGDPATLLYHFDAPEFIVEPAQGFQITNSPVQIQNTNTLHAMLEFWNTGSYYEGPVQIQVEIVGPTGLILTTSLTTVNVLDAKTVIEIDIPLPANLNIPAGQVTCTATVTIDPYQLITEDCDETNNNSAVSLFTIESATCPAGFIFENLNTIYCHGSPSVELIGNIPASFAVNGVPTTEFNPTSLSPGYYFIVATYTDPLSTITCTESMEVQITPTPLALFTSSEAIVCQGSPMLISYTGNGGLNAIYNWNFGSSDDYTVTDLGNQSYSIVYLSSGIKSISLEVINTYGCSSPVHTQNYLVNASLATPILNCSSSTPHSITIDWIPVPDAEFYTIQVDGTSLLVPPFINTYTINGLSENQSVMIQMSANNFLCGSGPLSSALVCQASACIAADIQITGIEPGESICENSEPISFQVSPVNTMVSGSGISGSNGNFLFTPSGLAGQDISITFSTTDLDGCQTQLPVSLYVDDVSVPILTGTSTVCAGTETYSYTISNDIYSSYNWVITNGTIIENNGASITAMWNEGLVQGEIAVSATDSSGCVSNISELNVLPTNDSSPVALFYIQNESSLCIGEPLVVTNASDNASSYHWEMTNTLTSAFDTSSSFIPDFTISSPGIYNLSLTAYGCGSTMNTYTVSSAITLYAAPQIQWNIPDQLTCIGDTILLQTQYTTGVFHWSGPGIIGDNLALPQAVINQAVSSYHLSYTDINGCIDEDEITINVDTTMMAEAAFEVNTTGICEGENIHILNNSNGLHYYWTVISVSTAETETFEESVPVIIPQFSDTYIISLLAEGCMDTDYYADTISIEVFPKPAIEIESNALEVCPGDTVFLSVPDLSGEYIWAGEGLLENTGNAVSAIIQETGSYTVVYTDVHGCDPEEVSLILEILEPAFCTENTVQDTLIIPNVITPDGDDINDTWQITGLDDYPSAWVEIYSRWGRLLYLSAIPYDQSFNGDIDGQILPTATYYYIIHYNDGVREDSSGTLTIIR